MAIAPDSLSGCVTAGAAITVGLHVQSRRGRLLRTGTLWQPGIVIASEQGLPQDDAEAVLPGGERRPAVFAGRDPGTNVAVFRVEGVAAAPPPRSEPTLGMLVALTGSDGEGAATARLGMVHQVGPAWTSMAGGRIDQLIRLDARLSAAEEGGPVMDGTGLLGMSTLGPRRRVLVIPGATIDRVLVPLLEQGRVPQGWLGLSLHPVAIPASLQKSAGGEAGLMVVSLAPGGPAEQAGLLPGDIVVAVDGEAATHARAVAQALSAKAVGAAITLSLLRGGEAKTLPATIGARPAP
jgi:S1-C subfamily serine protease